MTSVCCECQKILRTDLPGPTGAISHGLCPECVADIEAAYFASKRPEKGEGGPVLPLLSVSGGAA